VSRDLLFEIGVEELPAGYVLPALEQFERGVRDGLGTLRLEHGEIATHATPRRLAILVAALDERQSDFEEEALGPAVKVAFDAEGKPTRALIGFCAGKGVDVGAVRRVATPKGEYVAVTVRHVGRAAADVLPDLLATVATKLQFPKLMRWTTPEGAEARFARPVRWLVALLGQDVLPVKAFGLTAGRASMGHRFLKPGAVEIAKAGDYLAILEKAFVRADHRDRGGRLVEQAKKLAAGAGGALLEDEELIEINTFLGEWPTAFMGEYDRRYAVLPNEVKIAALKEHQRFFSVTIPNVPLVGEEVTPLAGAGPLLHPYFIVVRNGDDRGLDRIRKGNHDVLVARLEDALFYWNTDLKHPPGGRVEQLSTVVWMEGLGSLRDKATRLESLSGWLAERLAPEANATVKRAALLCKTDLLGEMIGSGKEYASLEGVIGGYYARESGEPQAVAEAIYEHYRPRGASDTVPVSAAGRLLSLADKLDHVAGAFVAGKIPTGSEDPFGVRRAGNGVVRVLVECGLHLDLRDASMEMTRAFFAADPDLPQAEIVRKLGEFWRGRVDVALEDRGIPYDKRDATLEAQVRRADTPKPRPGWIDPADALDRARVLAGFAGDPRFGPLVILFKRVANILAKATEALPGTLDAARLTEPAEQTLLRSLETTRAATEPLWGKRDYSGVLPRLLDMEEAIHGFFDAVMVNVDDLPTRINRLELLAQVRALFSRGWDLSRVVVEGEKS
jgi:glycyl-tRNA synthetase beta chain